MSGKWRKDTFLFFRLRRKAFPELFGLLENLVAEMKNPRINSTVYSIGQRKPPQ